MRSARTSPPELELTGCDFKYFLGGHDSLIQVETNNFGLMGERRDDDSPGGVNTQDLFLSYLGEDRGARISITNSTFKHSSFCKGMIYYKKLKDLTYEDAPLLVNFTA